MVCGWLMTLYPSYHIVFVSSILLHINISDISCIPTGSIQSPPRASRIHQTYRSLLYRSPLLSRQESLCFQQEKEVECSSRSGEVENVDWSVEINPKVEGIRNLLKVQHWRRRRNYHIPYGSAEGLNYVLDGCGPLWKVTFNALPPISSLAGIF